MDDDIRSAGKVLVIPNPPWGVKPPRPIVDEPPAVDSMLEWKQAGISRARAIADQVVAQLEPAIIAECQQLANAHYAAQRALRDAQAELAQFPDITALPIDQAEAVILRQETMKRLLPGLQQRADLASAQLGTAITEARSRLDSLSEHAVFRAVRRTMREKREQIVALETQIGDLQMALSHARTLLQSWGADSDAHPLRPTPEPEAPAVPRKRGLFG